jgi:hypothetical protein
LSPNPLKLHRVGTSHQVLYGRRQSIAVMCLTSHTNA